jgi:hypothetical protein
VTQRTLGSRNPHLAPPRVPRHSEARPQRLVWRPVAGTVQLFLGLILLVLTTKTPLLGGADVLFLTGLALAGSSIIWFGVFGNHRRDHWR